MNDLPNADADADAAQVAGRAPAAVVAAIRLLDTAGHDAFLVGPCVRVLHSDTVPREFEIATSAQPEAIFALFPMAAPTSPGGRTITLPTAAGPVDVRPFRYADEIAGELGHRDFTVHAVALDPLRGARIDPEGGIHDLASGSLRAVGDAVVRLAEDPLRALRAARLVAELDLSPDPALETAMKSTATSLTGVAPARIRPELRALLLAPGASAGLALLRRTGVEAVLAPGVQEDAAGVVARLPQDVDLRLAAWLRGTRAVATLRRLRHPRPRVQRIERILALHPVDGQVPVKAEVRLRRLLRRAGHELRPLLALREAEIAARGAAVDEIEHLETFRRALERIQRAKRSARQSAELALDGRAVMEHLDCRPGPRIGRALRHLADAVAEAPECNTPERLRTLLDRWVESTDAHGRGVA